MLKKVGLVLIALVAVLLVYVGLQSPDYVISREITIQAKPEKIFPFLNNSKLAEQWEPWKEVDPGAVMVYSGPEQGVHARTDWDSHGQLGTGSATIVESDLNTRVALRLEYVKPMNMVQNSEYLVHAAGEQSVVIWRVTGQNNFIGRLMCVFINMDKMVGGMFEKGLANLKTIVEKTP